MTEEGGAPAMDTIQELKDEFAKQFAEMKQQNEETVSKLNETIEQLKKDNASLQAAVVRSATMEPPAKAPEKTPEELYNEKIQSMRDQALEMFKKRGNYRCQQQLMHSSRRDSRTSPCPASSPTRPIWPAMSRQPAPSIPA